MPANSVIQNGQCSGTFPNGQCDIICNAGYTGSQAFNCSAAGTWSGSLTCQQCPSGQYQNQKGQASCISWSSCSPGVTYQTVAPTYTSDVVCAPVTAACNSSYYQKVGPTLTSNRVCYPVTLCGYGQYQVSSPTPTTNRVCSACSVCGSGQHALPGTCSGDVNTICTNCSTCSIFQYQFSDCASFTNRICNNITACPIGYGEIVAASSTSDRICGQLDPNSSPPTGYVFVDATVLLTGMPSILDGSGNVLPSFELLFPAAVASYLKSNFGTVLVSIFSASQVSGHRRSGSYNVTVSYRVQGSSSDESGLTTAVGNTAMLSVSLAGLGQTLTGTNAYSGVTASFPKKPEPPPNNSGSSSGNNNTLIIAVVAGIGGGVILIVVVLIIIFRNPRQDDIDLSSDLTALEETTGGSVARDYYLTNADTFHSSAPRRLSRSAPWPPPTARARPHSTAPSALPTTATSLAHNASPMGARCPSQAFQKNTSTTKENRKFVVFSPRQRKHHTTRSRHPLARVAQLTPALPQAYGPVHSDVPLPGRAG